MGATVPGLYSHITHSVDKEEEEICPPFKGTKLKQTRGREEPKGKPQGHRQTHLKPKRQRKPTLMIVLLTITTMIITLSKVKTEAADLSMVKAVTGNLEVSHKEAEAKDLSIINVNFRTRFQRGAYQQNHTQYSTHCKPYF